MILCNKRKEWAIALVASTRKGSKVVGEYKVVARTAKEARRLARAARRARKAV